MAHVKIKSSDIVCEILQILYVSVSVNHLFRGKKKHSKGGKLDLQQRNYT